MASSAMEHVLQIRVEAPAELSAEEVAKLIDTCLQIGVSDASDTISSARRPDGDYEDAGDLVSARRVVSLAIDAAGVKSSAEVGDEASLKDSITITWTVGDLLTEAPWLTREQAVEVLQQVKKNHDATLGITNDRLWHAANNLYPMPADWDCTGEEPE